MGQFLCGSWVTACDPLFTVLIRAKDELPPSPVFFRSRSPKYNYEVLGNAVSSPSGVWGEAPADNDFGAI